MLKIQVDDESKEKPECLTPTVSRAGGCVFVCVCVCGSGGKKNELLHICV